MARFNDLLAEKLQMTGSDGTSNHRITVPLRINSVDSRASHQVKLMSMKRMDAMSGREVRCDIC